MNVITLEEWAYRVHMEGGFQKDTWRLTGKVYGHPNFPPGHIVHVSTPKKLDGRLVTTFSGRIYELGYCEGNEKEQLKYIQEDIERDGTQCL